MPTLTPGQPRSMQQPTSQPGSTCSRLPSLLSLVRSLSLSFACFLPRLHSRIISLSLSRSVSFCLALIAHCSCRCCCCCCLCYFACILYIFLDAFFSSCLHVSFSHAHSLSRSLLAYASAAASCPACFVNWRTAHADCATPWLSR